MNLELAIVLECSPEGCRVEYLDREESGEAAYSAAVRDKIRIRRGPLVAIDRAARPPQLVWRLFRGKVQAVEGNHVSVSRLDGDGEHHRGGELLLERVTPAPWLEQPPAVGDEVFYEHGTAPGDGVLQALARDGRPVAWGRLSADLFPRIEAVYKERGA